MFEAVPADMREEILKPGNLHHAGHPECVQAVLSETPFAHDGADLTMQVVGIDPGVSDRPGIRMSRQTTIRMLPPERRGLDLGHTDRGVAGEFLGPVATMEKDALAMAPVRSVSQALGNRFWLIRLITPQALMPKFSCIDDQH
jgi:hypothetical protein